MKYAPSALIGRLSRSAGSTTASHNRFGAYLRNRVIPTNPQTAKQTAVRGSLATSSMAWKALTQAQREGWTALGASIVKTDSLGETYTLNGLQAFVLANRNRFTTGLGQLSDAPALPAITGLTTLSMTASILAMVITFAPTPIGATFSLLFSVTPGVSAGISFMPRSRYKLVLATALNAATGSDILAAYTALYGIPIVGQKIFLTALVLHEASGITGPPFHASVIVA